MCYKHPGPRCSSHAHRNLKKATRRYLEAVSGVDPVVKQLREQHGNAVADAHIYDLYSSARLAQDEFDATPRGIEFLKTKIASQGDFNGTLQYRLDKGVATRKFALNALAVADQGDVEQDMSRHGDDAVPTTKREYMNTLERRAKNLQTALGAQASSADLDVVTVAQEDLTDLTTAGEPAKDRTPRVSRVAPVKKAVTATARRVASSPACHGVGGSSASDTDCHGPRMRRTGGYPTIASSPARCH